MANTIHLKIYLKLQYFFTKFILVESPWLLLVE